MPPLTAIDFEASCLPRHGRSYPIEVGIADERGVRSWLIRPEPAWRQWDWTAEAQALHGLTRDRLERDGLPAPRVAAELAMAVSDRRLVADSGLDAGWLATLLATGGRAPPAVAHVATILDVLGADTAAIEAARSAADTERRRRHRAGDDARWLFGVLSRLNAPIDRPLFDWRTADAHGSVIIRSCAADWLS